ncbi:leukocyte cell-derived chemotaxin-2-like isoform X1 [Pristis pectinata]|uniref:leukocyte cell-derived chemotaxin-2-like isoform X1 n=1 Tax=Pristis pectinata TaxID=685728 RepID=UPI00223DDE84|nr:leukocyte cell-derived chemotaxin-2-like isoform X1 [Pristis pectinata]
MLREFLAFSLFTQVSSGRWGQMCAGNPRNQLRSPDIYGTGDYGSLRGTSIHRGVDLDCRAGVAVYAPFTGQLTGREYPFRSARNGINHGVGLEGSGYCIKMFLVNPSHYTGRIRKGQKLGKMVNVQHVYPLMNSHLHIQMCNSSIDPTPYL